MPISPSKNMLKDLESGDDFLKNLARFTDSTLDANATLFQKHGYKSIWFRLSFVLDKSNYFKYGRLWVGLILLSCFKINVFFPPYVTLQILVGAGIFNGIIVLGAEFYKFATFIQTSMITPFEISISSFFVKLVVSFSEYKRSMDNLNLNRYQCVKL